MKRFLPPLFMVLLVILCCLSRRAAAQAWVPDKGEGSFSTTYNYIYSRGHFATGGRKLPEAAAIAQNVLFEAEYGVIDRLALTVSVPVVAIRYADTNPPSSVLRGLFDQTQHSLGAGFYQHGFLDDGSYHSTIQDIQLNVRYNVLSRPAVVTPFVAVIV